MPPSHPARSAATRSSLSARQWQDLRQAARLARSEGVSITWRRDGSILISPQPLPDISAQAGNRQRAQEEKQETARDAAAPQPMETDGGRSKTASKKQQRDARRLQEYQESKQHLSQLTARWRLLTQRLLWTARKESCNAVWTAWMRSRTSEARLAVLRQLRGLLWRAWTRPQFEPPLTSPLPKGATRIPTGLQMLGARSLRDDYVLARVRAFTQHPSMASVRSCHLSKALWSWMGYRRKLDFDHQWGWKTPHSVVRNATAADITTPAEARDRKKKSRGGKKS